jgi:hypothetical protein
VLLLVKTCGVSVPCIKEAFSMMIFKSGPNQANIISSWPSFLSFAGSSPQSMMDFIRLQPHGFRDIAR